MQIAKILTNEKVLTVTAYHAKQKGWTMPEHLYQWCAKSVSGILERWEYTGCTVNFKTYTKSLKFKKRLQNPKENQRIFEERRRQSLSTDNGNGYRSFGKINAGRQKPVRRVCSPALSAVLTVGQNSTTVPATATKMIRKTISSVPITRAIPVPAGFIISVKLRCINGCWNVFNGR